MRIALLGYRGNMQSGGQGIYLHALSRELAEQGHSLDVFVGPPYPDPMPWARVTRLDNQMFWGRRFDRRRGGFLPRPRPARILEPLNFYEFAVTRFGFFPEPFAFSLRAARALLARLRQGERYLLVHDVQSLGYGLLWLQALGLPVVSTLHHPLTVDLRSSLSRDRGFMDRKGSLTFHPVTTQGRVARRLAGILTSSEVSRDTIARDFRVPEQRIHNVLNGVQLPDLGPERPRPEPPELLFVGRAGDPNKGLDILLAALLKLAPEIRLRCLSPPPFPNDEAARWLRDPALASRVSFDGKRPRAELESAYRRAAVVVVPSLFEGFGLPAIEALASGTPVVASRGGALPEVLGRAGAGRLLATLAPETLAAEIQSVLDDWDAEQRAVRAARGRIERLFGWEAVARRTADVYQRVRSVWPERRGWWP
ncbi:MAG: glycosyltransferase family 4 protein [Proteobacteria bacterium]|nr:glycosyltransferase family 4 protein [Pseudomonadota bacterium]